ncbi:MAG: DUF58 domain-containing protein [Bacteroidales bacterium]|nr:DUF58 domain-containing protein [Bacteroidales bacterium]
MDEKIKQLMQRVRRIEIKTNALSSDVFAGQYHSAFKGRGMSFAEVREYQPGDDVRDIDWNVTARFDRTYVKVFEEERELSVFLLIDVSCSLDFGTQGQTQRELLTEIAATLAFSAMRNGDKIGVLFFSDRIEKFIPPAKGKGHVLRIIRELLCIQPEGRRTDIALGLEYFLRLVRRRSVTFLLSDFLAPAETYASQLTMARSRHDVVAVQAYDERLASLPDVGLLQLEDAETGHRHWVDTSSRKVREAHALHWQKHSEALHQQLRRARVDAVSVATGGDYVKSLQSLFLRRTKARA